MARPTPLAPVVAALMVGAALAGAVAWRLNLQSIDRQIVDKRSGLKKLMLTGKIPPNNEVQAYLALRQDALQQQYLRWRDMVAVPAVTGAAATDAQLFFQEQFHEVQRTLERLAAARNATVPEVLGFPKELPPSDMVPRLLAQLSLLEALAQVLYEQGIVDITALKIEDPQPVTPAQGEAPFLVQTPVRVRANATLSQFVKGLAALDRARPIIDVLGIKSVPQDGGDLLEVELVLARYVVASTTAAAAGTEFQEPVARPRRARRAAPDDADDSGRAQPPGNRSRAQ